MGLADVIEIGKKIGYNFENVRIVAIQPKDTSGGEELSETIRKKIPELAERVLREMES